jgi:ABC-type lipoprotein export system ATPase subunit
MTGTAPTDGGQYEPLVVCAAVARTFGQGSTAIVAVHGVSCAVARGDAIAITGPSGSGKSTLLHLIAGLDEPSRGAITWPALGGRGHLRPGPISFVFQGPSLIPDLNVLENVALPSLLRGVDDREARRVASDALDVLDLGALTSRLPDELSGGQAQRVAVARALAGAPALIVADEPTGQLDHDAATLVTDALLKTASRLDAALVVATHDLATAGRLSLQWTMTDGGLRTTAASEASVGCSR